MSTADGSFAPWRPQARLDRLVMSHVGEEVLVYDETTHAIHHLNPTTHLIWTLCDGTRTLPEIAQAASAALETDIAEDLVHLALRLLGEVNLLNGSSPPGLRESRQSRRVMLRRLAVAGGVALPALASVSAATAGIVGASWAPLGSSCSPEECCDGLDCYVGTGTCRPAGCLPFVAPC